MSRQIPILGPSERQLLLDCGRVELEAEHVDSLTTLVREPLDWDAITFYARLHSVAPLVHHHLRRVAAEVVPRQARRRLLGLYQRTAYQNKLYAHENGELVDAFAARDVPVIAPKGVVLADREYGNLALRPLIDLVFLVRPERVDRARRLLVERGYREERLRPFPALFRWSFPQPIFKKPGGALDLAVVLQWNLVTWPRLHRVDFDLVFDDAKPGVVAGRDALLLSPVDLLLYLCLQADNHGYLNRAALASEDPRELLFGTWSNNRLVRFVDIGEVIRHHRDDIDWDILARRARMSMLEDPVHASLTLARRLVGAGVPGSVLEALRPSAPSRLRRSLLRAAEPNRNGVWRQLPARHQIRLAQLVGLAELTFPRPDALRRVNGHGDGLPLPARYAVHAGRTIARSTLSFVAAATNRGEP
jgi:hypothetical protein